MPNSFALGLLLWGVRIRLLKKNANLCHVAFINMKPFSWLGHPDWQVSSCGKQIE